MTSFPKILMILGATALLGFAAYSMVKPKQQTAEVISKDATGIVVEDSKLPSQSSSVSETAKLGEGSGPDARVAAKLLDPNTPVRGPLRTEELKHIQLTDQDGKKFSLDDLKGDTVLVNFMFAGCTSICPVQTVGLRRVHDEMQLDPEKDRIKILSISIAPLSDTPELLKQFAQRFEIDKPSWRFAVTSQAQTDELSELFGVGVKPLEGDQLDHRSLLYLINHEGMMIQQYRGNVVDVERLKNELRIVDQMGRSKS